MKIRQRHPWALAPREARLIQSQLAGEIVLHDDFGTIGRVAGVDVGFEDNGGTTRAAVAILAYPSLQLETATLARTPTLFPYVPGLLSFREAPAVLEAMKQLDILPDLLLCDGQGIAHPRRLGIASHLGLLLDIPSIGVAKSRLIGTHGEVPDLRGAWVPLKDGSETIGAVLRTRQGVKPLFISPGHRIGLESAIEWVMACVTRYRLPETTRWAHRLASEKPNRI
ncbi:MAG: deoxyribonuclease V [Betaproteobacteria bacterium HGW-Betaproteobacteria-14]|nr:MAG: deoxyribonuclease V [Betaproteobacteria bacterium HGW-Betaproteobacteria-14]